MTIDPSRPSPHYPVRPQWLARNEEPVMEPELEIVDPHHHLWDRPENRYLFHDLLEDLSAGHKIIATMFMECAAMYRTDGPEEMRCLGETEFAMGNAAMAASGAYGECESVAGIVAHGDLRLGDAVAPVLEAHRRIAGSRFQGIRQIVAFHEDPRARGSMATPPPHLLMDKTFREGMAVLARMGLNFDTFLYHTQLDELTDLAQAFPDVPIILNHVGGPIGIGPYADVQDEVFSAWRKSMAKLAACENTVVKLGGMGMKLHGHGTGEWERPPTSEDLAALWGPYVTECIELFGVSRCMFESNFPVDKGSCGYRELWNAFKRITAHASADEKAALYKQTAIRVYKLNVGA